ncbi:MAG: hypothetical protein A2W52_01890 [Candidatus Taylorbacteria bacterium RIFCSPHIGHO2_02_49_25]|uniref:Uncharacterized protein n=1 Tax=Candidatus Taylorbacteria bacterium RIFCSPHIGHO2_02_49_25 TaxID=1802305 RepID=A0A1G2MCE5_9BACT|nr:MAG: hypothetical protein A2W52_01890 [Candidatus Taylorbacteria bacterium RIFCSPHIGHO2_02_49_25]OHA46931.1 MAG: hypothetical protein A3G61_04550 [Candidatus Taylorbacteria bacterium RIFCSPLOWO2_12_FULL_49_67]
MGAWFFGLTFLYFILSSIFLKSFGLLPQYGIVLFFGFLFFFGLSFLPSGCKREDIANWLLFISFMLISFGGGTTFTLTFVFGHPLSEFSVTAGAIMFMIGIFLMIVTAFIGNSDSRPGEETSDAVKSFRDVTEKLKFGLKNTSTSSFLELESSGSIAEGSVIFKLQHSISQKSRLINKTRNFHRDLSVDSSIISLRKELYQGLVSIESVNEAIDVRGTSAEMQEILSNFIKEKQLNSFDFRLVSTSNLITLTVNVLIEENQLWLDYLELVKLVVTKN